MSWRATILIAAGCGRVGFDAVDTSVDASGSDGVLVTYRDAVIADAPISYWRLADTDTTARDEMGRFRGTFTGTCARGAAPLIVDSNVAAGFDGSTCQIQLPTQFPFFTGNAPCSVEVWVSISNPMNFQVMFMRQSRSATDPIDGYALVTSPGGVYFERVKNTINSATGPGLILVANRGYHVVGVYDGATITIYIDGQSATPSVSDPAAMPAYTATPLIGASPMATLFIGGTLDEIALYDHALSPDRIDLHHRLGRDGPARL